MSSASYLLDRKVLAAGGSDSTGNSETHDSYTRLMLHSNGTDGSTRFTDSATAKTITANGNVQIDTAQSKFGGASALFDGAGDYLSLADNDDWNFGTGNWTFDSWVRFNMLYGQGGTGILDSSHGLFYQKTDGNNDMQFYSFYNGTTIFSLQEAGVSKISCRINWTPIIDTWYHIGICRYGTGENNMKIFINGISQTLIWSTNLAANYSFPDFTGVFELGTLV